MTPESFSLAVWVVQVVCPLQQTNCFDFLPVSYLFLEFPLHRKVLWFLSLQCHLLKCQDC